MGILSVENHRRTQVRVENTQVLSWPSIPGKNKYGEVGKILEKWSGAYAAVRGGARDVIVVTGSFQI